MRRTWSAPIRPTPSTATRRSDMGGDPFYRGESGWGRGRHWPGTLDLEAFFELFETGALRFGNEQADEYPGADVDENEQAEGSGGTERVVQQREQERDDGIGAPQDEHCDTHREAADTQREDLREQQPHAGAD